MQESFDAYLTMGEPRTRAGAGRWLRRKRDGGVRRPRTHVLKVWQAI